MIKRFSSFTLDTANECVWRGESRIQLAPKAYGVLRHLVDNPGRIVTKEELLQAVWPDTFVQESVLKTCVLEIRKALGENPRDPKHISTVHRRGYRFVVEAAAEPPPPPEHSGAPAALLIGRGAALESLRSLWRQANGGQRQVAFVTGEPGIGKSTLIARFVQEAAQRAPLRILSGQCIEHFGASEPYYPILGALAAGAKGGALPGILDVLRRHAPTWLVQLPGIPSLDDGETLKQETLGATRERMLREMSEAIEALSQEEALLLVVEDVHWSDVSTLDLISTIANRTGRARLLLIASYRPVDVVLTNHPVKSLKQTLQARGRCVEIELEMFGRSEVAEFLGVRFPSHRFPGDFAERVYARTDGNPLFVTHVLEFALSRSLIENRSGEWHLNPAADDFDLGVPESLSKMIATQAARLTPEEQIVLEAASVAGVAFAVPSIAEPEEVERWEDYCDGLTSRNLFLRPAEGSGSERPPGAAYRFTHAVYRDTLYRRLPPARRMRLHRAIGERLERLSGERLGEAASELAQHFQACHDTPRAVLYLRLLAQRCARRHALPEAADALVRAMDLAAELPEPGRAAARLELTEQIGLVYRLMGALDAAAAEFERMDERARSMGYLEGRLRAQLWLASVTSFLDRDRCLRAADTALTLCNSSSDPELKCTALGQVAYWNLMLRGWDERDSRASAAALEAARTGEDRVVHALHASRHSFFQSLSSRYREACDTAEEGIRIATELECLHDYSVPYFFQAWALLHLGEWGAMQDLLQRAIDRANRNGHDLWALLFGLLDAFLHIQACSFASALEACRGYLDRARLLGHSVSIQIGMVMLGHAELGTGNPEAARRLFEELREWQSRERVLSDWFWKLPLQLGLTELFLASGELQAAREEAERFLTLASETAECTWRALAHHARARVAILERDPLGARREIARGLEAIEGREAPLAAWRLHALAAEVMGEPSHLAQARAAILRLAGSLAADDPLRACLLAHTPIRAERAGACVACE
ncbi:MAG: AAA family ATPase [Acidobacteriia bacterium]|nr:AAA family ATPase [Terriglobia bacterium]